MKVKTLLLSLLVLAHAAHAEDPPPLPPNPFANLPPNNAEEFDPFDDNFDGAEGDEEGGGAPPRIGGPTATPGGSRPGLIGGGAMSAGGSSAMGKPAAGAARMEPANAKDVVENFDYPDAEILDVTKAIAKLTGKNFIYNPQDIKGRISVVSQTPITVGDAWNAFLTALNMKGFAMVPSGKYLRIERIANAKEKQTPIYSTKKPPNNDEFITRVIPLRYIDAAEFEQSFRLWMPREARMQAYAQTNTIIITDTATHINRMVELINLLDVAGYQESLVVIPVRNAPAKDIAKLIEQILNENKTGGSANRFGAPPRPQAAYSATARTGTGSGRSGGSTISKIIADDRTGSLIVKANAAGILEIRALVRRLDQKVAVSEGSGRIHVIQLQFSDAETLAKTLQSITGGGTTNRSTSPRPFGSFGEAQGVFQGEIKVAADKTTQSIVVTASPSDFATLKKVVETLDVPRDQVFIEAMIMEMRLSKGENLGTSFVSAPNGLALPSASGALTEILGGNPLGAAGFALGFKSGRSREVTVGSGDAAKTFNVNSVNALVELIQKNTDANVVATPKIIALDNETATFEISEEIKLKTQTTANNGQVSNSFSTDKAQTSLKVTPQINKASNFVKLDIDQRLENFNDGNVPVELLGQVKGKNIRSTVTKVVVQNEDTIVLSGLIRDSVEESVQKVPFLGDIPILGWLFKNTKAEKTKTNLLVFITPTIIKQYSAIRKVLNKNLDERDDFVRETLGSKDPFGRHIEKMKKGLPDLTVIEPMPQAKPIETSSFNVPSPPEREDDIYDDPNAFEYPPEIPGGPIPGMDSPNPEIDMGNDAAPPPVVMPQPDEGGQFN